MPLNIPGCTGQMPIVKNYLALEVKSTEIEEP